MTSLFTLLSSLFKAGNSSTKSATQEVFLHAIKLVDSRSLQTWDKFPKYQEFEALSYYDYLAGLQRINQLKQTYEQVVSDKNKLRELDSDEIKVYKSFTVEVAPSLFHKTRKIGLEIPVYEHTVVTVSDGIWEAEKLRVKAKWSKKFVSVTYACPSHVQHAGEISLLRKKLAELKPDEKDALSEIQESQFTHPVLFISHRWETREHPDPSGNQLQKLRALKDCFIIYDYASFPQEPLNANEAIQLQGILKYMSQLIQNVIVLHSADYIDRGWCIYEYIASSLLGSIVCDEIRDTEFVALRNWVSTRVGIPRNLFRDSWESQQQNHINDSILSAVNKILPLFKTSSFTNEEDRKLVRMLLLEMLKNKLPAKKEHQQYLGEWKTTPWTDDELSVAFENELTWEKQISISTQSFNMNVPHTIEDAVNKRYQIDRDTSLKFS